MASLPTTPRPMLSLQLLLLMGLPADPNKEYKVVEASDSSPDKTIRRVVDELKAQTTDQEVCELSDSSPARKTKDHQLSKAEKVLAKTFLNCPDFPHYLLVTPPPEDLWDIFAKTMAANKKIYARSLTIFF
ncbi:hypothetical protein F2Q70_00012046 [Brassica cretica]|uniref:Uncharacterized protein n=1 Tax=Brassica cretica TaxID=69181 RepID=A0A8S9LYB2_BRACR|nr:hypothetical protein F2Q70_00012046 [Brassica cretica]